MTCDEGACDAVMLFYYGLRNCFSHGDLTQTYDEKGSMGAFLTQLKSGKINLTAERLGKDWTPVVINWFNALAIVARNHHFFVDPEELNISNAVLVNMQAF